MYNINSTLINVLRTQYSVSDPTDQITNHAHDLKPIIFKTKIKYQN